METRIKYPRTPHFRWSPGATADDIFVRGNGIFDGKHIIITEKMDGENTTIYRDGFHARSLDSAHSAYHSWLAAYAAQFQYMIPENMRICGEYLYAQHSISYDNLESYFLGFSAWNVTSFNHYCLAWCETVDLFEKLGITSVPVLYSGIYRFEAVKEIAEATVARGGEGIVVRNAGQFAFDDFSNNMAKYVRPNHVQTDKHWRSQAIVPNKLKKN